MAIQGAFLPSTQVWDTSELFQIDVNSDQFKELLVRMYQNLNRMSVNIAAKETGGYILDEILTSNQYFQNPAVTATNSSASKPLLRSSFRTVVNMGTLATKSIPHGITMNSATTLVRLYGAATNSTTLKYIPLPYVGAAGNTVELNADATNINIVVGAGLAGYDRCMVIIEYLKN